MRRGRPFRRHRLPCHRGGSTGLRRWYELRFTVARRPSCLLLLEPHSQHLGQRRVHGAVVQQLLKRSRRLRRDGVHHDRRRCRRRSPRVGALPLLARGLGHGRWARMGCAERWGHCWLVLRGCRCCSSRRAISAARSCPALRVVVIQKRQQSRQRLLRQWRVWLAHPRRHVPDRLGPRALLRFHRHVLVQDPRQAAAGPRRRDRAQRLGSLLGEGRSAAHEALLAQVFSDDEGDLRGAHARGGARLHGGPVGWGWGGVALRGGPL